MLARFAIALGLVLTTTSNPAAQQAPRNQATIAFLHSLERPDGGFAVGALANEPNPASSLQATTAAFRALKYFGGTLRRPEASGKFIISCYDEKTGGFGDAPGKVPTSATTAVGLMAIIEMGLPADRYREGVIKYLGENAKTIEEIRIAAAAFEALKMKAPRFEDWLRQIAATRNADGSFGDGPGQARATGVASAIILRLGGSLDKRDAILKALRAGQRADGGFGSVDSPNSDLTSTYQTMRAFMMLNQKPNDMAKLRAFIASCRNSDGGYSVTPRQPSTAAATYYAGIVLHWLELP